MDAVAPGTYWQVIAVAPDLAAVIRQALVEKGFPALVTPANNTLYRVVVGPYTDAATRDRVRPELEKVGFQPVRVELPKN